MARYVLIYLVLVSLGAHAKPTGWTKLEKEIQNGHWGLVDSVLIVQNEKTLFSRNYPRDYTALGKMKPKSELKLDPDEGMFDHYDSRWHPKREGLHTTQSVTKSVIAALVAMSIERGELEGLDQPVAPFFEDLAEEELPESLTLGHLLDMTAGFEWNEDSEYGTAGNDWSILESCGVWIHYALSKPSTHKPGTKFTYNSGLPQLVGYILEDVSGKELDDLCQERLFAPLGIEDWYWKTSTDGEFDAQGGLYLTADSLAKIGQLHLNDGRWNGKQLLPKNWTSEILSQRVSAYPGMDYSRGWWILKSESGVESITGIGYGGQRLYIVPEKGLVVVVLSWNLASDKPGISTQAILDRVLNAL